MPGIFGLISKRPREWAESQLRRMGDVLDHERFYTSGRWIDEPSGVYVGWNARENSFSDGMPVRNETGSIVLVFSGEEYPDPDAVRDLSRRGHVFGADDPSYLAHFYEEDILFPKCLNGRFHGIVVDIVQGTAKLFNDRYGMHRLYYHEAKDAFYFAVEAKAILTACPELRRPNLRSFGELVGCGCVLENRTLFDGLQVLPPASCWIFRSCEVQAKNRYFEATEWEQQELFELGAYEKQVQAVFSRNLPRYLNCREKIGLSLTGGLDTRAVMAWQRLSPGALTCYTYGEANRDCRDVIVARKVAEECRQPHEVIRLGDDFLKRFPHYAERSIYLTDGCVDVTRAPDLYLSERAREIAPTRMTGLYGDEVLRPQHRAFKPMVLTPGFLSPDFLPNVAAGHETYSKIIQGHPTSFATFRQAPWHHFGILALEQTQLTVRTPFLDNDFVSTVFRGPRAATENNDLRVRLIREGNSSLARIRTDRGFAGDAGAISGWLVRNFQEFTFKAEYAYDYGMPQWLARVDHVCFPLRLERFFLGRHKLYHYRSWYRDCLASYVREILLDSRTLARPYLVRNGVETIVRDHLKGLRNYTTEIHRLLSLELIHRLFLDSN